MKALIRATAFLLMSVAWLPSAQAKGIGNPQAPHLIHSTASPSNARVPIATYHFGLHIVGAPLAQLMIDLPSGIKLTQGIEVTNQTGQKVEATTSMNGNRMTIAFAQPIPADTLLEVNLNGVKTSDLVGRTWFLPIAGKNVGATSDIPYGLARIQTHK